MIWSKFSIKILGVHFENSVPDNSNWDEISHILTQKTVSRTEYNSLWDEKKRIVNQILLSKLWYIGQIYTIPKFTKEEIAKAIAQLSI